MQPFLKSLAYGRPLVRLFLPGISRPVLGVLPEVIASILEAYPHAYFALQYDRELRPHLAIYELRAKGEVEIGTIRGPFHAQRGVPARV